MDAENPGGSPLTLTDLVAPLSREGFLRDHWDPGHVFISEPNPRLVEILDAFDALKSPRALTSALAARPVVPNNVNVFGPNSFRSQVPATAAMDFCRAGFTLYMTGIEQVVPEAARLFSRVCAELGFVPRVYMEAFAAHAGSVSSWHYDHDINFQILLSGEKEWLVAPNTHIRNPISAFHPSPGPGGAVRGFVEELYARDPDVPPTPLGGCQRLRAVAGSVVFLPRAYWHQVHATTDCFGVNLVIKGRTWAAAIAAALQYRLEAYEEMRGYVAGLGMAFTLAPIIEAMERQFPALKDTALRELHELTLEEVPLTEANTRLEWAPAAASRHLVERDGQWFLELPDMFEEPVEIDSELAPFVAQLVRLRCRFTWSQLIKIRGDLQPTNIRALVETMKDNGILVVPE